MKCRRLVWVVVLLALYVCLGAPARAGQFQYAWSGKLLHDGVDPWQIGPEGANFELSFTVAEDAHDLFDTNIEYAAFWVVSAQLKLDSEVIPYVGNGYVEFDDYPDGIFDLVMFGGEFAKLGQTMEIGTVAALPTSTFTLTELVETPLVFAPTATATQGGCCGGTYTGIVPAGIIVTAVPEPAAAAMLLEIIFVLAASGRRFRWTRNQNRS